MEKNQVKRNKVSEETANFIKHIRAKLIPTDEIIEISLQKKQLRLAAVLLPLFQDQGIWKLLFIHRSNINGFHRGEVAFPGGGREIEDQDMVQTALRETREELGIDKENIQVLGRLLPTETVTNYLVTPIVGIINWPLHIQPNPDEVERVFSIPLDWLMANNNWKNQEFEIPVRGKISTVAYEHYDNEILWGFTAKLTQALIAKIKEEEQ